MIDIKPQAPTVQTVYSWFDKRKLWVNRRYQRKLVWTLEEKQALIDSILCGYPLPNILLAQSGGRYEIIDGLQRLHTFVSFIDEDFCAEDGRYFPTHLYPTAKLRRQKNANATLGKRQLPCGRDYISEDEASAFLEYQLSVSIMLDPSEELINTVFNRINTYGHHLSGQERRQAGIVTPFSDYVRKLSCNFRGDTSPEHLELSEMPSISVEPAQQQHGYTIQANNTYWGKNGIIRGTELRGSEDEQCIAELVVSILDTIPERRSKALDQYYSSADKSSLVSRLLNEYGQDSLTSEIKYCFSLLEELAKIGNAHTVKKLVGFNSTNSFGAFFDLLVVALHRSLFSNGQVVSDMQRLADSLSGIYVSIGDAQKTSAEKRAANVDQICGKIQGALTRGSLGEIYKMHEPLIVDHILRFSRTETASVEFKQGILKLNKDRDRDDGVVAKVLKTVCGMANAHFASSEGTILIGVADKVEDANRIAKLDNVDYREVGGHFIVGCDREARVLGVDPERYLHIWRDAVDNSSLSEELKRSVLNNMQYYPYHGLGVIVLKVPKQSAPSTYEKKYWERRGDQVDPTPVDVSDVTRLQELFSRFVD